MSQPYSPNPPAAVGDPQPASPRKITTAAGNRLQTVLEGGEAGEKGWKSSKFGVGSPTAALGLADPDGSGQDQSYTAIWSDAGLVKEGGSRSPARHFKWLTRRGGWKRLLVLVVVIILVLIGLVVGLVVGLRSQSDGSGNSSSSRPSTGPDPIPQASAPATTSARGTVAQPAGTRTGATPTATPSGFPTGAYSFVTFLNTVSTDCTSNPSTWRCAPYTLYSESPDRSMATFNWNITGSSAGDLRISSISNPFQTSFTDIALSLMDRGKPTEHYFFQVLLDKQVRPTSALTDSDVATVCFYNATTFQAYLYTKLAKDYPTDSTAESSTATYQMWPFAARAEEVIGGGDDVPNCYTAVDNRMGERVNSSSLAARPAGDLCDCLYLNYLP